nr:hypothetical protein REQ54_04358 [Rhizobium sp. Q54]
MLPSFAHERVMLDFEMIVEWQQRGVTGRVLGLLPEDNPLLKHRPEPDNQSLDDWRQKVEAWLFGWSIEDAMRR